MNPVTLLFLGLLAGGLWLYYRRLPAARRGPFLGKGAIAAGLFLIGFLALTGRLYLLGALVALLLPFLRRLMPWLIRLLPFLARWYQQRQNRRPAGGGGKRSRVTSRVLDMELDHDSGELFGRVIDGPLAERDLADLTESEFIDLLRYCRETDAESARLLETYLDKRFGERWRADDPGDEAGTNAGSADHDGPMTTHQALEILGLEPGADRDAIIQAHRRLMQKLHPDRGGSPYLAARINAARSRLLED